MTRTLSPRIVLPILFLILIATKKDLRAQMNSDGSWQVPGPGVNNVWFSRTSTSTVFVFVHGLNSDSRCWLYQENGRPKQYWPYLVTTDSRIGSPAVFLGGYNFGPNYTIFDAVTELNNKLTFEGVLQYQNVVFIAHSMGGVVARRLLCSHSYEFRGKKVGLPQWSPQKRPYVVT